MTIEISTVVSISDLPAGLRAAVEPFAGKRGAVKIHCEDTVYPSTDSRTYTCANVIVFDLDDPSGNTMRRGVWGGNNGFNRAPIDRAWDPVFDTERHPVPVGGAVVVGTLGDYCFVSVHTTTFAERFVTNDVARDALLTGRLDEYRAIVDQAAPLTDEECAILYGLSCLTSAGRKPILAAYPEALDSCVQRGFAKRAKNGASQATAQGKALEGSWRKRGEALAWKVR